jgi:death-on-curing protein
MKYVSVEDAVFIHDYILDQSGGLKGIRDTGLLESCVRKPQTHLFGINRYKNAYSKAAALLESIALYHPFNDGNKRSAMAIAGFFLFINGLQVTFTNNEYDEFMIFVVQNKPDINTIESWLKEHTSKII